MYIYTCIDIYIYKSIHIYLYILYVCIYRLDIEPWCRAREKVIRELWARIENRYYIYISICIYIYI